MPVCTRSMYSIRLEKAQCKIQEESWIRLLFKQKTKLASSLLYSETKLKNIN